MKVSAKTLEILKNFAQIEPTGLVFPVGSEIATTPVGIQNIIAEAEIEETIDERFAINDISQLYNCLTSFDNPTMKLDGLKLVVQDLKNNQGRFVLNTASERIVKRPPGVQLNDEINMSFSLTQDLLGRILKSVAIVQSPQILVEGDGANIAITGIDRDNSGVNQFTIDVGQTGFVGKVYILSELLTKLYRNTDYAVAVSVPSNGGGMIRFQGDKLRYYIAVECKRN